MYMALTTQLVEVLQDALDKTGHDDVKVSSRPNVNEVEIACSLLGIAVSELFARLEQEGCPAWCQGHPENDPADHVGVLLAGDGNTLSLSQGLGEEVTIHLPDDVDEGVTPARARHLASALRVAAGMADQEAPCSSSS